MDTNMTHRVTSVLILLLLLEGVAVAEPVRNAVIWSDATGGGTAVFEGNVTQSDVSGRLDFAGQTFVVVGTVDEYGAVDGSIETDGGEEVGTFETTVVGGELSGEFDVTGFSGGLWASDSSPPPPGIPNTAGD